MLQGFINDKSAELGRKLPQTSGDNGLSGVFTSVSSLVDTTPAHNLLSHLEKGTIYFEMEEWIGPHKKEGRPLKEMLLRAFDEENQDNIFTGLGHFYSSGLHADIDSMVVATALTQAFKTNDFPVTINISPFSAVSESFWNDIAPFMEQAAGQGHVVFEILETDDSAALSSLEETDIKVLQDAKNRWGFSVALDDHRGEAADYIRLEKFASLTDHVKLDGQSIRDNGQSDLLGHIKERVSEIANLIPGAGIVVEWVDSFHEARFIFRDNPDTVLFVQGKNLSMENDPRAVSRDKKVANTGKLAPVFSGP